MRRADECHRLPDLADALWTERHLMEQLLFKLVSARQFLDADDRRFVPRALAEVEQAVERLWSAEQARTAVVQELADDWRLPADTVTLARLADETPEPWRSMLAEHRRAFRDVTREIEETVDHSRHLATATLRSIRHRLAATTRVAGGPVATHPPTDRSS